MEFRIATHRTIPDVPAIERSLREADPAALVDFESASAQLRISTFISAPELAEVVDRAGFPVSADQVIRMPSECCGGCGG